ncbi:MAG: nucleoside hydrolase-like domain-containing protein [Bacteroidales bacterium]
MSAQVNQKNRAIILTDVENEPDDSESLVRLLLYSNVIDIKGIIATTSVHMKKEVHPESIQKVINAYGKVQANLLKHEAGFPEANSLLQIVKQGLPEYGMGGVGNGKDSQGSDWIIHILDENDPRPLWVCIWGGPNTLAQALYKIKQTRPEADAEKLVKKIRVYTISDQDDSGIWMRKNFPDLFYIVSPGGYESSTWSAINQFFGGINNTVISNSWLAQNIQQNHGPLGAVYPDVAYGMEGDTPTFLFLVPNGLNNPEHPEWGGWGGRYEFYPPEYSTLNTKGFTGGVPVEPEPRAIWTNASDMYIPYVFNEYGRTVRRDTVVFKNNKATLFRWRDDFQNDFAARMDWCTKLFQEANHPPVPSLGHPDRITVKSGGEFVLDASGTTDPDGDNLSYLWFQYPEAGTYKKPVPFGYAENLYRIPSVKAPVVDKQETTQFILKVTDKGNPPLTRYKRVIVNILP